MDLYRCLFQAEFVHLACRHPRHLPLALTQRFKQGSQLVGRYLALATFPVPVEGGGHCVD
jgi:hypothetical protein